MQSKISRRDFLKLVSISAAVPFLPRGKPLLQYKVVRTGDTENPNIIILLFDALSASNMSLYGYGRATTPNMDRFAEKAIVYHSHYAPASYTTPSTASLFTGVYPWTHRSFQTFGPIKQDVVKNNLWRQLGENQDYQRLAYSQNLLADSVLHQFAESLDKHLDSGDFSEINHTFHHKLFPNDGYFALRGIDEISFRSANEKTAGSLVLSMLNNTIAYIRQHLFLQKHKQQYPLGMGRSFSKIFYTVEDTMDASGDMLCQLAEPTFAYLHYYFPHGPYVPNQNFVNLFKNDTWKAVEKGDHPLSDHTRAERIEIERCLYDEYIANIDDEFGRVMEQLEADRLLENSYIIVTSDHGELFERGKIGHSTAMLYEPLIHIPLIISKPGQQVREDVFALTSTIDLLPTILRINGQTASKWCEGELLPALGGETNPERSVFSMHVTGNSAFKPLTKASLAMVKGQNKIISFFGYQAYDGKYELYNLAEDPEELDDLYSEESQLSREMKAELDHKLKEVNAPYQKG